MSGSVPAGAGTGSRGWTLAGLALGLVPLFVGLAGPHLWLSVTCADLMYGAGWICFTLWIALATLATPLRTIGAGGLRSLAHAFAGSLAWSWWTVAVMFADLQQRAELLHLAYVIAAIALFLWRFRLHDWLFRRVVRHVMTRSAYCPGTVLLAGGRPDPPSGMRVPFPDALLGTVARWRNHPIWVRAHRGMFGPTGDSRIILHEAMAATDGRCLLLRRVLAGEGRGDMPDPGIAGRAGDLALTFRQEVEIWVAARPGCDEVTIGEAIQARALAVYGLLAICIARGRIDHAPEFERSLEILIAHESLAAETAEVVRKAGRITPEAVTGFVRAWRTTPALVGNQRLMANLAAAGGLARLRLFRPAKAGLAAAREELEAESGHVDGDTSLAAATLVALRAEIERCSITLAEDPHAAKPRSTEDERVLKERRGREEAFRTDGRHPDSGQAFAPSDLGRLPDPRRPREVGAGLGAALPSIASVVGILACLLALGWSWTPRLKVVADVPFGGSVIPPGVQDAEVGLTGPAPTILMPDRGPGIATLDLASLRPAREGGPGTPLDGPVRRLVSNPDGSAIALFDDAASGDACVSARDRQGRWSAVIPPAMIDLDGNEVEAFLSGLSEPLLLRRDGPDRLLRYDEEARSLRVAKTNPDVTIEGRFVASAALPRAGRSRGLILVTSGAAPGPGTMHLVTESRPGAALEIGTIPSPPLSTRTIVAVAADTRERLLCIDSGGGAWQRSREPSAAPWLRLRPGVQDLQLDSIDLALVDEDDSRLWMVRKGEIWTRALPSGPNGPSDGRGWTRHALPAAAADGMQGRPLALMVPGAARGIYVLVPARPGNPESGSVLRITCEPSGVPTVDGNPAESITIEEGLATGNRLVDVDVLGEVALLAVRRSGPDGGVLSIEILGETRRVVRTSPSPPSLPWNPTKSRGLIAVNPIGDGAIAVFDSGEFIRIDPTRDLLRPADPARAALVGAMKLPPQAIDVAFDADAEEPFILVLLQDGSVSMQPVRSGSAPGPLAIDTGTAPPTSILNDARFVLTDPEGAVLVASAEAWRFSVRAGSRHFTDMSGQLGQAPFDMLATRSADGTPGLAWLSDGGGSIRHLFAGSFDWQPLKSRLAELRPRLEGGAFGLSANGELWAVDIGSDPRSIWPSHGEGPSGISGAAIRRDFVDFLGPARVHSISRATATWSASPPLVGDHSVHSVGPLANSSTLLLPTEIGIPKIIPAGRNAAGMQPLDALGPLERPMVLGDGVLGAVQKDGRLGWISADGSRHHAIGPGTVPGLSLAEVHEASIGGNALYLRGTDGPGKPASTLVRYPLTNDREAEPARRFTEPDLRSMRVTPQRVYTLSLRGVVALDPSSLAEKERFPLDAARPALLAEPAGTGMALATEEGIDRLVDATRNRVLAIPEAQASSGARMAAAWADRIVVFDATGAWARSARANDPFRKVATLGDPPDALAFGPDGASVWARIKRDWVAIGSGTRVGRSLGWTSGGQRIECSAEGNLLFDEKRVQGFDRGERPIGLPVGLEPFGWSTALLVGRSGSMLVDLDSGTFPKTPEILAQVKEGCRIIPLGNAGNLAWNSSGEVIFLDRFSPRLMFGGASASEIVVSPSPYALLRDGKVVDADGTVPTGMPPLRAGEPVKVTAAAATGSEIIRLLDDRTVDRIGLETLGWRADSRTADALARIGSHVLGLDRKRARVQWLSGPAAREEPATDWFAGSDAIALVDSREQVRCFDGDRMHAASPERQAIPGEIKGNLVGTAVALVHRPDGTTILFDLLEGLRTTDALPGQDHVVAGARVLARAADGRRFMWIDATGRTDESGNFESTALGVTGSEIIALGLQRRGSASLAAASIDPADGSETATLRRWDPEFPMLCGTGVLAARIARIDARTRLIIGSDAIGIDDGRSFSLVDNPARTTLVGLAIAGQVVHAILPSGDRRPLFSRKDGEWTTAETDAPEADPIADWRWDVESFVRIPTVPVTGPVRTVRGTLDTGTGWILQDRPTRLVRGEDSIEIEFPSGKRDVLRTVSDPRSRIAFSAPLMRQEDGAIAMTLASGPVRLGIPATGAVLPCHRIARFAPVGPSGASAWIDPMGQLWLWNGATACLSSGRDLDRFSVDDSGRLFVSGRDPAVRMAIDANGAVRAEPRDSRPMFDDASRLPSRAGAVRWRTRDGDGASIVEFTLEAANAPAIRLAATSNGFDVLAAPRLVVDRGQVALAFTAGGAQVVAPVEDGSVNWAAIRSPTAIAPPPTTRDPSLGYRSSGGREIRIEADGASLEIAGERFRYRIEEARFDCNDCRAAGWWDGRIITVLGNGAALAWRVSTDGLLSDPKPCQPPPGGFGDSMWNLGPRLIAESAAVAGANPLAWERDGEAWKPYTTDRLLQAPEARWNWNAEGRLIVDGETFRLEAAEWPRLDCELIDLAEREGPADVRMSEDGSILYRTVSGRWFGLTGSGMPRSRTRPEDPVDRRSAGPLEVSRWRSPGATSPDCRLRHGDLEATIDLRVRDGLIADLDAWDPRSRIVRVWGSKVLVATAHPRIHRPIEVRQQRLHVLDPIIDPSLDPFSWGGALRKDDRIGLGDDHALRCGDLDLGPPDARGFPRLDPRRTIPFSLSSDGILSFADDQGAYSARVGSILDSIAAIESSPGITGVSWELRDRSARFVATAADGRKVRLERGEGTPRFLDDPVAPGGGTVIAAVGENAFDARMSDDGSLVLKRAMPEPCEITIQAGPASRLVLAHLLGTGIDDSPRGFAIRSRDWVAEYERGPDGHRLVRVVKAATVAPRLEVKPIGGGLFARRGSTGTWEIRVGDMPGSAAWPLVAFRGPDRTYLDEAGGIIEVSREWSRRAGPDGLITDRWPDGSGAPLADDRAYRDGSSIRAGDARFMFGEAGITAARADGPLRHRGAMDWRGANGWDISLDRASGALQASFRDTPLGADGGCWPMDFGIAVASSGDTTWLIDRFGRSERNGDAAPWTPHEVTHREMLEDAGPGPVRAIEDDRSLRRLISLQLPDGPGGLLLPLAPGGTMAPRPPGAVFTSWTDGSQLEAMLDTEDAVHFRRRVDGSRRALRLAPVPRNESCRSGRFAFDSPLDVVLAVQPDLREPRACIEMRTGWEWVAIGDGGSASTLREESPARVDPAHGSAPSLASLEGTGLSIEQVQAEAERIAGRPFLWIPIGERLFHLGEREALWIELGPRWRRRPLP